MNKLVRLIKYRVPQQLGLAIIDKKIANIVTIIGRRPNTYLQIMSVKKGCPSSFVDKTFYPTIPKKGYE